MNITTEKTNELEAILKVEIEPADYKEKVESALKKFGRDARIPGFRPGKVPAGLLKKRFGTAIMAEELERVLQDGMSNYIENELGSRIFGRPIQTAGFDTFEKYELDKNFSFEFEMGMQPEINLGFIEEDELEKPKVDLSDADLDELIEEFRKKNFVSPEIEEADPKDFVSLELHVPSEEEDNLFDKGNLYLRIEDIPSEKLRSEFIGAGKGIEVSYPLSDLFAKDIAGLAKSFNIDDLELNEADLERVATLKSINIHREGIAEMNQEFFDRVFGQDVVKTEEEFKAKYREAMEGQLNQDAENMLVKNAIDHMFAKASFNMPENFLKKLYKESQANDHDHEHDHDHDHDHEHDHAHDHGNEEEQFKDYLSYLRREVIVDQLLEDIGEEKIEYADLLSAARADIIDYFRSMGMPENMLPADRIDSMASEQLKDDKAIRNAINRVKNTRLVDYLRTNVKFAEKPITYKDFVNLIEQENVQH